jgi:hypothetical protein
VNGLPSIEGPQGAVMKKPIKILHIDRDYQVSYFILRNGSFIQSSVPRKAAIALLKKECFDLIISEPHQRALLTPQEGTEDLGPLLDRDQHHSKPGGTRFEIAKRI